MSGNGAGRTLSGDPAEPLPSNWARPSSAPRVGRIGDWSGSSSSRYQFSLMNSMINY